MYKIIIDSCGELTEEMKASGHFVNVPLTLIIDGLEIIDDETFDQKDYLRRVAESPTGPKSACPSPHAYLEEIKGDEEHVYIVTLSAQLSGSYNSAVVGRDLFYEENAGSEKKIHVFDSKSASIGETLIGRRIAELEEQGLPFEEIIPAIDAYIEKQTTFFVLETMETFRKNGRLSNFKAKLVETLNIKPVMSSTEIGYIKKAGQGRGMTSALNKMVDLMLQVTPDPENRELAISHCNCPERAEMVRQKVESLSYFKNIFTVDTRGVSSTYACDGGVIMVS